MHVLLRVGGECKLSLYNVFQIVFQCIIGSTLLTIHLSLIQYIFGNLIWMPSICLRIFAINDLHDNLVKFSKT